MSRREICDPEMKKAVTEAMRNREMGNCRRYSFVRLPQTTLQRYVEDRQDITIEAINQNFVGSKFFLVKEKMFWLSTVL